MREKGKVTKLPCHYQLVKGLNRLPLALRRRTLLNDRVFPVCRLLKAPYLLKEELGEARTVALSSTTYH